MRPNICVFVNGVGPNLIRVDVLETSLRDRVHQRDMPESRSTSDTKLKVSGTIALHLRMGKSRIHVKINIVKGLLLSVLLERPM